MTVDEARVAYEIARSAWADEIGAMVADDDGALCDAATAMTATLDALIAAVREEERREAIDDILRASIEILSGDEGRCDCCMRIMSWSDNDKPIGHATDCCVAQSIAHIRARKDRR